jgi:hypothetical protein
MIADWLLSLPVVMAYYLLDGNEVAVWFLSVRNESGTTEIEEFSVSKRMI